MSTSAIRLLQPSGFGDLTAREDIGRIASILEALIGQLYIVTVVAVLVGNQAGDGDMWRYRALCGLSTLGIA
jgi:hypothetical protein